MINLEKDNPLLIGCSGGGGHNAAIIAIAQNLPDCLKQYDPLPHGEERVKQIQRSLQYQLIQMALKLTYNSWFSPFIKWLLPKTAFPLIPSREEIENEIKLLKAANKQRPYVDMLLDVYPVGYEKSAIWNQLQKKEKVQELKKLIRFQRWIDSHYHKEVKNNFLTRLEEALTEGNPYTRMISTQAMALPALCDAIIEYNSKYSTAPKLTIHQYITDLPSHGAAHFFNTLTRLSAKQRSQMFLYGINFSEKIIKDFKLDNPKFKSIINIDPAKNPMVRTGFTNLKLQNLQLTLSAQRKDKEDISYIIHQNEKVASIMLGSQAGIDTLEYVKKFLDAHFDKIFIFGGNNENISREIDKLVKQDSESYTHKIIFLDNQDDAHMAPIMTRSDAVVIKGGGLSVMEQMAMEHKIGKIVFIHHTSGISWEDKNVESLIDFLKIKGVTAKKTSIKSVASQLSNGV